MEQAINNTKIEETIRFHLLDDETRQQLDEVADQAKLQIRMIQGVNPPPPGPISCEVGGIPEDELERVDANVFRPTEVYLKRRREKKI